MSYMPNRRCRHAQLAGRKSRLIQQVCHHARRLEEWHRYWKNRKWQRWGVALCEFHTRRSKEPSSICVEQLYLLDHHLRKAYCVFETGDNHTAYPYKRQCNNAILKPPIKSGRRLPTFDELMDMEEEGGGRLGSVFSIAGVETHGLHEFDADTAEDKWHVDLNSLFGLSSMRSFLPAHFPKDYRFPWLCSCCGTMKSMKSGELYTLENDNEHMLCGECYHDGLCQRCEDWSEPDSMRYYNIRNNDCRVCEVCYDNFLNKELTVPLDDYLEAEHADCLEEPLDQDAYWMALMKRFQEYIIEDRNLTGDTAIWFEDPRELVDEAIAVSTNYSSVFGERIPWYERKSWHIQLTAKLVPAEEMPF